MENLLEKLKSLIESTLSYGHIELVDVELKKGKKWIVRVFIDMEGGVTVDTCAHVSRQLEDILDKEDIIPTSYILEVSSPGVERILRKEADFEKFKGNTVRIKMLPTFSGTKFFRGRLLGFKQGDILLEGKEGTMCIPHDYVSKAHLEYTF
ncbi:MAG: ribosome maturation factor RimP [Thermodesulfobacteriota bacterium]|nr:ribosome maturation factor RimP [Thermodesulfobacteriota bacterium]